MLEQLQELDRRRKSDGIDPKKYSPQLPESDTDALMADSAFANGCNIAALENRGIEFLSLLPEVKCAKIRHVTLIRRLAEQRKTVAVETCGGPLGLCGRRVSPWRVQLSPAGARKQIGHRSPFGGGF